MFLLFIPKSSDCAVSFTWGLLNDFHFENKVIITNNYMPLKDYLVYPLEYPIKQFVFAHGRENGSGIEINHTSTLSTSWWNSSPSNIAVFYTCYGAQVLSNEDYNNVFDDWLSYNDELFIIHGDGNKIKRILDFWRSHFIKLIEITKEKTSVLEIKKAFEQVYVNSLLELDKMKLGELGDMTKSHLIIAMDALESKHKTT